MFSKIAYGSIIQPGRILPDFASGGKSHESLSRERKRWSWIATKGDYVETLVLDTTICLDNAVCSDGICCFACVIGEKAAGSNTSLKLVVEQRIHNSKNPRLPVLTSHQVFESCADLKVISARSQEDGIVKLSFRCSVYQKRHKACREYPADKRYHGPCLYNEYLAPMEYKTDVYKYDWAVYYAVEDNPQAIHDVFGEEIANMVPHLLKTGVIRKKKLGKIFRKKQYLLLPVPANPKVLLVTKEHQLITSLNQALKLWPKELNRRKIGMVKK